MRILVLGGTGGTGRLIIARAKSQGHGVVALVRSPAKANLPDLQVVAGDARDPAAIERALEGCDAVVSALGTGISPVRKVTLLSDATRALLAAMSRRGVRRLVCITGTGAGDSRGHGGFVFDRLLMPLALRQVYADKDRQEALIRASGLDWVIVRPTVLNNTPATGQVDALTDLHGVHGGTISREDVARFVVDQLADNRWLRQAPLVTTRPT